MGTHGLDIDGSTYTFHQSWLNTFANCPEQARLELVGQLPRESSDAAAIGQALHTGVETVLRDGGELGDAIEAATERFFWETEQEGFRWVQVKTVDTAARYVSTLVNSWYRDVYPQLGDPIRLEDKFDVPLEIGHDRIIRIAGAYDFIDHSGIWDWKTANRPYEQWEVDRFKIQPTVYSAAYAVECLNEATNGGASILSLSPIDFTYAVGLKGRPPREPFQLLTTTRGPEEWKWLTHQLHRIIDLVEADLERWPLNDQGWHCSPRWCSAWDECKGKYVTTNVGLV